MVVQCNGRAMQVVFKSMQWVCKGVQCNECVRGFMGLRGHLWVCKGCAMQWVCKGVQCNECARGVQGSGSAGGVQCNECVRGFTGLHGIYGCARVCNARRVQEGAVQ